METVGVAIALRLSNDYATVKIALGFIAMGVVLLGSLSPAGLREAPTGTVSYGRDIRPLLADRCFKCHGSDANAREAGLRLDTAEGATSRAASGRTAIKPGDPSGSEMLRRICSDDAEVAMPPAKSNKPRFSDAEAGLLRRWIEEGARYESHWAFVAPKRPPLPAVQGGTFAKNPIDLFILQKLEERGIAPSPPAPRDVLLRRVFLDLTGLPPTPEERVRFIKDSDPDAFEKLVDRLFTEEPWRTRVAERLTAPWLDQARYADTSGIHTDAGRQMWPWRDWVIAAFRENKPFDTFVVEQLAGDLLPNATMQQKVASGFNRNHVTSDEGGAIAEEYLVEYAVDRVATTGSVFLGLTLGCARCHDHKYDPVSQEEFYQLFAFYNSIEEPGLYSQLPDANRAFEPFMEVPSPEQEERRAVLRADLDAARANMNRVAPGEDEERVAFLKNLRAEGAGGDDVAPIVSAVSRSGAQFIKKDDGSAIATGANPEVDDHEFVVNTTETSLRMLVIEAIADPALPDGRVGRAENGNAVLTGVVATIESIKNPGEKKNIHFHWARADHEQTNGNFRAVNVLDTTDRDGWAVQGHEREGSRALMLLADAPFGYEGGSKINITLQYQSVYARHTLGRIRFHFVKINDVGMARLPVAVGDWFKLPVYALANANEAYTKILGPETDEAPAWTQAVGNAKFKWSHQIGLDDGRTHELSGGPGAIILGRAIYSPTARELNISLGSDDGIQVWVNGKEVFKNKVERGVAPDQDRARLPLKAGVNLLIYKIVNTGGPAGFYYREIPPEAELSGDLSAAWLPESVRPGDLPARIVTAWRMRFSKDYKDRVAAVAKIESEVKKLEAAIPLTMIMKELPKPRETFVLTRGQYDLPDRNKRVQRRVPAILGALAADAPADRLGLARWLTAPENPLFARVTVNRFFEMIFGAGIVQTTEDFGVQGDFPSHPELLDWLAVEFRETGFDIRKLIKLYVTSATYRQSSRVRPEVAAIDPSNRLLASFPRTRLTAEQIRDSALFTSGLLVEKTGGPSAKPVQPPGLWEEVAMPASNTKSYQMDRGDGMYRRSLYTYWKRACPPPSLMTLDAPTREFCTVRRNATNTPLQALVLWNDEQFVEAARALADREWSEPAADDTARLLRMFQRCTGGDPDPAAMATLQQLISEFRDRYSKDSAAAAKYLKTGPYRPKSGTDPATLAAWAIAAGVVMALDASITRG